MQVILIIATLGYMTVTDIKYVTMETLEQCAQVRDAIQPLREDETCKRTFQTLMCVEREIPMPKPRPKLKS
jgi:hypothetical protein